MGIKMVEDLGAPGLVTAVDLLTLEAAPDWNEWAAYGMTAAGYLGGWLRFGGDFVKNIGIASLPLTARHIRDRVKGGTLTRRAPAAASRYNLRAPVSGGRVPVSRSYQPEFEAVGPHAF